MFVFLLTLIVQFYLRILEVKNEMVLLEHSEFHFLDDVLADLKLTPVSHINYQSK